MTRPTRWATDTDPDHSQWYIDRFRTMAAEGVDLAGEARLIDAILPPGSRVLDAGCGPGRVGAHLFDSGHDVVGVDADPVLIEAAKLDHPGPRWCVGDLAELDLPSQGVETPFAGAVIAGNVMTFVAQGTEAMVLRRIGAHIVPDGVVVVGFGTDRGYPLERFDDDVLAAGLHLEQRFATWDLRPWCASSEFAVSLLRVPRS
ncbi:MAG: class I SAM-dependent methyltransferase [Actinomycetes bacterium]